MLKVVTWVDGEREPQCAPNPHFPKGKDIDVSHGAAQTCYTELPYPARRCGVYHIECGKCGQRIAVTTAGRPDDPKSLKVGCIPSTH